MAREVLKKIAVLVLVSLVFTGCGQQVSKIGEQPATGLPVRVGLQNEKGLPVEVKVKNEPAAGGSVALNLPEDKKSSVEIDTKEKQVIPVKVEGLDNLEKFLKAFIADVNKLSARLNLSQGSQLPLHVEFSPIPSKILMVVAGSVLLVLIAVFGALLAAFFAWRTSLNMKMIEKKIRNTDLDK
jgi:hypothetical protein